MNDIAEILRAKGLKVTPQRLAIYQLLSGTTTHPSAEDIYKALMPTNPTISLATVYKTLDSFRSVGLVQELSVGNGRSNYDAAVHTHPHIVCTCCNAIEDFDLENIAALHQEAAEKNGLSCGTGTTAFLWHLPCLPGSRENQLQPRITKKRASQRLAFFVILKTDSHKTVPK